MTKSGPVRGGQDDRHLGSWSRDAVGASPVGAVADTDRGATPFPCPRPTAQIEAFVQVLGEDLAAAFLLRFGGAELILSDRPSRRRDACRPGRTGQSPRAWPSSKRAPAYPAGVAPVDRLPAVARLSPGRDRPDPACVGRVDSALAQASRGTRRTPGRRTGRTRSQKGKAMNWDGGGPDNPSFAVPCGSVPEAEFPMSPSRCRA